MQSAYFNTDLHGRSNGEYVVRLNDDDVVITQSVDKHMLNYTQQTSRSRRPLLSYAIYCIGIERKKNNMRIVQLYNVLYISSTPNEYSRFG